MKIDKILFIGLGGSGQRHLRIFHALYNDRVQYMGYRQTNKTPLLNPDYTVNPNQQITDLYPIKISGNLDELLSQKQEPCFSGEAFFTPVIGSERSIFDCSAQ